MEIDLLLALQEIHTPFFDFFFTHITALGDMGILWIAAGILLLCTRKYRRHGFLLLLSLLFAFLLGNVVLKNIVARDRPCWIYPDIPLLIENPKDYSFPSAHSMVGFAAAVSVWYTHKKWGIAALILAALIAFSRLYLFVHWPTDVIVGIILGILTAVTVFEADKWINRKKEGKKAYENV